MSSHLHGCVDAPLTHAQYRAADLINLVFRMLEHEDCKGQKELAMGMATSNIKQGSEVKCFTGELLLNVRCDSDSGNVQVSLERLYGFVVPYCNALVVDELVFCRGVGITEAERYLSRKWVGNVPADSLRVTSLSYRGTEHSICTLPSGRRGQAPGFFAGLFGAKAKDSDLIACVRRTLKEGFAFAALPGHLVRYYEFVFSKPHLVLCGVKVTAWPCADGTLELRVFDDLDGTNRRTDEDCFGVSVEDACRIVAGYMDSSHGFTSDQWTTIFRAVYTDF